MPLLLGLLDAGPQHGYALYKTIETDLKGICHIGMNRLYALLDEMESQGLIHGQQHASTNGPARKTYQVSPKGRRVFEAWLATPCPTMREMRVDFPPRLYLAQRQGIDAMAVLIERQHDACQKELSRMTAQMHDTQQRNDFLPMIYDFRIGQITAGLAWLEKCRQALGSQPVVMREAGGEKSGKKGKVAHA